MISVVRDVQKVTREFSCSGMVNVLFFYLINRGSNKEFLGKIPSSLPQMTALMIIQLILT